MEHEVSLTEKQRFWLEHIRACEQSGQTMQAYAEAQGLTPTAFYNWKAALRRKGVLDGPAAGKKPLFTKATVVDGRRLGHCRVVLPSGIALEFDATAEPAWVAQVVDALASR